MGNIEKKSIEFLINLTRIIRTSQMYNSNHPAVKKGLQDAYGLIQELLSEAPNITLGKGEGGILIIQDIPLQERNPTAEKFVQMLEERNINSVKFERGATQEELQVFVNIVSTKVDRIMSEGHIKPELISSLKNLKINEARYQLVADGEELVPVDKAGERGKRETGKKGVTQEKVKELFDKFFNEQIASSSGATGFNGLNTSLDQMLPYLKEIPPKDRKDLTWGFFERALDALSTGIDLSSFKDNLISAVMVMNPIMQQLIFGHPVKDIKEVLSLLKNFTVDKKISLLTNDIKEGKGEKDFRESVNALLKTKGEVVKIAEMITQKLGQENDPKMMDQLLTLIQSIEKGAQVVVRTRGCAYVIDTNAGYQDAYRKTLEKEGFDVLIIPDGKEALTAIKKMPPDLLVMDVKIPGVSGIEILGTLDREKCHIPVLLCSAMESVQGSFEVQMYPKVKFLKKPLKTKDFLAAMNVITPFKEQKKFEKQREEQELKKPEIAEELSRARDIQQNLLPENLPEIHGYDISAYYNSCKEVGGDYYDFIPLDNEHLGMIIADVSGKGISGAMVMVMARSVIRMCALSSLSPREVLTKANPLITRDIMSGMFITVYYMVLDIPNHCLIACCAGHNPGVIWDGAMGTTSLTKTGGMPLGILASSMFEKSLEEERIELKVGDRLTLYTDGVVECMSPTDEEFGLPRFNQVVTTSGAQESRLFIRDVLSALLQHQANAPQHDDITLVTIKYNG